MKPRSAGDLHVRPFSKCKGGREKRKWGEGSCIAARLAYVAGSFSRTRCVEIREVFRALRAK